MPERTVFTAGELAERSGVNQETLEEWITAGLLQAAGRGSSGTPFFSEGTIERVEQIRSLLEIGYSRDEVAKILRKVGLPREAGSGQNKAEGENLLTVGALSESAGVSPRTIKHWEDKGIIEPDARSEGGFRLYREQYVYLCNLIQDLQLFGYSLDQIKEVSDYFRDFVIMRDDLEHYEPEAAEERLAGMMREIEDLFQTSAKLRSGIERWEKLLNKHKKLVADLKRSNDRRRRSAERAKDGTE